MTVGLALQKWLPRWEATGFRTAQGRPVKNQDMLRYLSMLLEMRAQRVQTVQLQYVPGHMGVQGNEEADALAAQGTSRADIDDRDWRGLIAIEGKDA